MDDSVIFLFEIQPFTRLMRKSLQHHGSILLNRLNKVKPNFRIRNNCLLLLSDVKAPTWCIGCDVSIEQCVCSVVVCTPLCIEVAPTHRCIRELAVETVRHNSISQQQSQRRVFCSIVEQNHCCISLFLFNRTQL